MLSKQNVDLNYSNIIKNSNYININFNTNDNLTNSLLGISILYKLYIETQIQQNNNGFIFDIDELLKITRKNNIDKLLRDEKSNNVEFIYNIKSSSNMKNNVLSLTNTKVITKLKSKIFQNVVTDNLFIKDSQLNNLSKNEYIILQNSNIDIDSI